MFKDLEEFENFMETGWHWGIQEHTFYCYRIGRDNSFDYVGVPEEVLASYNRDLPDTMRAMLEHEEKINGNGATIGSDQVWATYNHLVHGIPSVCNKDGLCTYVYQLEDLRESDDLSECMVLEIIQVTFKYKNYGVKERQFVTSTFASEVTVSKSELDEEHPGWRQRIAVGRALGLSDMALARYVLGENPAPTAAIEGIEF